MERTAMATKMKPHTCSRVEMVPHKCMTVEMEHEWSKNVGNCWVDKKNIS